MPKATVATITPTSSRVKARCTELRCPSAAEAWYARALTPARCRLELISSASRTVPTYTIAVALDSARSRGSKSARTCAPFLRTMNWRFGRSSELQSATALADIPKLWQSALRVSGGAVAVKAINGTPRGRADAIDLYAGLKSQPQSSTQCASSTAIRLRPRATCKARRSKPAAIFSGVT
eukprot:6184476-Pleurochrysis_carterae.AAC.3